MSQDPRDPTDPTTIIKRILLAGQRVISHADTQRIMATLPRLRALLDELDSPTEMGLLILHLSAWTIAIARKAAADGDEERRIIALNLAPVLLSNVIANAWEVACERTEEAATDPIGEPAGNA